MVGRPSYTTDEVNNGALGETITFNSISDNPALGGDEKNFVGARQVDSDSNVWNANTIAAEDGEKYYIRMYVHNDNPGENDGCSKETQRYALMSQKAPAPKWKFKDLLPAPTPPLANTMTVCVLLAILLSIWNMCPVSAFIENNGIAAGGIGLSDEIVEANGVPIGYDALDGNLPGGYPYAAYVGIEVKVIYDYSYTVDMQVRPAGEADAAWQEENFRQGWR